MARSVEARYLEDCARDDALAYLASDAQSNLFLMDLVARFGGSPAPGEARTEIAVATRAGEIVGIAALHPSIVFDAAIGAEALEVLIPFVETLNVGLVKSSVASVDVLWTRLSRGSERRALVDRTETAYTLDGAGAQLIDPDPSWVSRPAEKRDLEPLVYAARESLREEDRPDPFAGDVRSFRRWVCGRVARARVVECEGRIVFVGYADVQRSDGWLLQGIYTWPEMRRRGFGSAGTSDLCREAFSNGAAHVQLAVVEGNEPARALYEGLGFKPFSQLRTILFA
jgi:ribosomal protein S18 acetylase RimI-like enzyme